MTGSLIDVDLSEATEQLQIHDAVKEKKACETDADYLEEKKDDSGDPLLQSEEAAAAGDGTATATTTATTTSMTDAEKLAQAKTFLQADQVLAAARLLRQLHPESPDDVKFSDSVVQKADLIQGVIDGLLCNPDTPSDSNNDWVKLGETQTEHRDTAMYYRWSEEEDMCLQCRLETPIESSLLVPLLAVLNETDLFMTWIPNWNYPFKLGLVGVDKLAQLGRTEQIIQFLSQVPWPLTPRDCVLQTCACDDIHDIADDDTTGTIAIKLLSLEEGWELYDTSVHEQQHLKVPPPPTGHERIDFDGGMVIRKCPSDHPSYAKFHESSDEHLLLVGFTMLVDAHITPRVPTTILNFIIHTVITHMWSMLLHTAQQVKDGERPLHAKAIAAKRGEMYDWVEQRIEAMFAHFDTNTDNADDTDEWYESEEGVDYD